MTRLSIVSVALDDRQERPPARGSRGLVGERRGSAAEGGADCLVVAPVAEPGLVGPEVTAGHCALDRRPDRLQRALEPDQLVLVGRVSERLAIAEVEQL